MAKKLSNTGIAANQIIFSANVSQSVDAFTGEDAYDISVSGSFSVTGSTALSSSANPLIVKGVQQANLGAANILINQASTGMVNFTSSAQIPVSTIQVKSYGEDSVSGIAFQDGALFASGSDDDLELYFYNGDVIKKVTLTNAF